MQAVVEVGAKFHDDGVEVGLERPDGGVEIVGGECGERKREREIASKMGDGEVGREAGVSEGAKKYFTDLGLKG